MNSPAAKAVVAAADDARNRQEAVETAQRHDALTALVPSCRHISEILAERFKLDATFELDPDGYFEETPSWFHQFNGERVYTEHHLVLTGWMSVAGERIAEVRAATSLLDRYDNIEVIVHVTTPRRWMKPKRTRVSDVTELRAALGV